MVRSTATPRVSNHVARIFLLTSPRLRGEVGSHRRCDPGEGDSPRTQRLSNLLKQPLTPTLFPQGRGEGEEIKSRSPSRTPPPGWSVRRKKLRCVRRCAAGTRTAIPATPTCPEC